MQPQNILPLLRLKPKSLEELIQSGLVSQQLGEKGMNELFMFLSGAHGLALEKGRVRIR